MLEKTKQKETVIANHTKREKGATNNIYKAFKISPRLSPSLRNLVEFQNTQTTDMKQLTPEENPTTNREPEEEEDMMKVKNDFLEFVERIEKSDIDLSRTNGYVRKRLYKKRTIVSSSEEAEKNSGQMMEGQQLIDNKREALSEDIVMTLLNQFSEVKKIAEENQAQIALTNQKMSQMDIMNIRYEQLLERIERLEKRDALSNEASTEVTEKNLVEGQQERQAQTQLQNQHVETSQDICKQDQNVIEKIKQEVTLLRKERDYYRTCFIEMRSISKEKDALISLMRKKLESARKVIQVMTEKERLDKADKEINVNEENDEEKGKEMKEDKITQDREEEIEREDKDKSEDDSTTDMNTTEQGEIKKEEIKTDKEEEEPIQIENEAEAHTKVGDHTKEIQTDTALQGEKLSIIEEEKTVEMNWVLESDMKEMERRHAIRQRMLGARQLDLGEVFDKERRRSSTTPPKALDRQEMALYKERREEDKRSAYKEEKGIEGEHEKEETVREEEGEKEACNFSSAREQKEEINETIPTEQINFESNMKIKEQKNWRTSKEFFYNSKIGALGLRTTTDSSFTQDSPSKSFIRENRGNSFNRTKPQLRSSVGDKKHVTLGIKRLEKDHLVAEEEKETQEDMDQEKKAEIKKADDKEEREKHNQKLVDEETTVGEEKPKEERERKQHVMRHSKEKKEKPKTNSRQKDERREEKVQKATSQKEDNESFEPFAIDVLGLLSPRQKNSTTR